MDHVTSTVIDLVEAAYELELDETGWFQKLLAVGGPILDRGLGCAIRVFRRPMGGGPIEYGKLYATANLPTDWDETTLQWARAFSQEVQEIGTRPGAVYTHSELWSLHRPARERLGLFGEFADHIEAPGAQKVRAIGSKDALFIPVVDPYGVGFGIGIHLAEVTTLSERERTTWRMLAAHLTSGLRLRQAASGRGSSILPERAEAILDPKGFKVMEARGQAEHSSVLEALREAARRVDRALAKRKRDPEEALRSWWALMHGRWSMVDWFDSDGRRFVLAHPNPANVGDPRGLTKQEAQVVTFAALGETGKMISYRIGMSEAFVSKALESAMRKLSVKTRAQLIERLRGLPVASERRGAESETGATNR